MYPIRVSRLVSSVAVAFALLAAVAPIAHAADAAGKPSIVFILADDLGWADVGFHGSEIKTPHLDALRAAGAELTQHYVQPVCSPTRAALLTGRYPMRYGLQVHVIMPYAKYGLPLEERTLAQQLGDAGYTTAISGKWHIGLHEPAYLPTRRGFDHQYGHYCGMLDYFTRERDGGLDWHRDDKGLVEEGYATDLITAEAVRLIGAQPADKPLFLYVPYNAPHSPLQAPQEAIDAYSSIGDKSRRTYAAMTSVMDAGIGRIVAALEAKGIRDNTLIVFCSDNGGPTSQGATNTPLRAGKGTLFEGGVRVPTLAVWPGRIEAGSKRAGLMHVTDWWPTLSAIAGVAVSGKTAGPLDGVDQSAMLLRGEASGRSEILLNVTPAEGAIRVGDWKLIARFGDKRRRGQPDSMLFNIAADPGETTDLAGREPAKVKELRARLDALAAEAAAPKNGPDDGKGKAPKVWGIPD